MATGPAGPSTYCVSARARAGGLPIVRFASLECVSKANIYHKRKLNVDLAA